MDLLERYLQAISYFLPRRDQDDILEELSENLRSQIEEREEEMGRPLTEEELAEILKRHGHPMCVAGRYRTRQHLIGPLFFPLYLLSLKIGMGAVLLVTVVLAAVTSVLYGDPIHQILDALFGLPGRALMVFAWTTLGFAALDFAQSRMKLTHKWDPRTLPKVVHREHRLSRVHAAVEFLAGMAALVWLLLAPAIPFLVLGPAAAIFDFAPVWRLAYVPIVLLMIAAVALSLLNVIRAYWTPARSLIRIALQTGSLLISALLLQAGEWVVAKPGATLQGGASLDRVVEVANVTFGVGLRVAIIIAAFEIGRELLRLRSRRATGSTQASAPAGATR